jgi:hypothetical protein
MAPHGSPVGATSQSRDGHLHAVPRCAGPHLLPRAPSPTWAGAGVIAAPHLAEAPQYRPLTGVEG